MRRSAARMAAWSAETRRRSSHRPIASGLSPKRRGAASTPDPARLSTKSRLSRSTTGPGVCRRVRMSRVRAPPVGRSSARRLPPHRAAPSPPRRPAKPDCTRAPRASRTAWRVPVRSTGRPHPPPPAHAPRPVVAGGRSCDAGQQRGQGRERRGGRVHRAPPGRDRRPLLRARTSSATRLASPGLGNVAPSMSPTEGWTATKRQAASRVTATPRKRPCTSMGRETSMRACLSGARTGAAPFRESWMGERAPSVRGAQGRQRIPGQPSGYAPRPERRRFSVWCRGASCIIQNPRRSRGMRGRRDDLAARCCGESNSTR
jgi:hypothetical protein